jgi:uncharacterized protein related to proFAR isomerase
MKVDRFVEECDDSQIYLIDIDPYFGKEMNFKVYRELAGIYDLWIDAASRKVEDVMDVLVSDAEVAVITGVYFWDPLEELMDMTDSVAMKSIFQKHIDEFIKLGGKIIIVPNNLVHNYEADVRVMSRQGVCPWRV